MPNEEEKVDPSWEELYNKEKERNENVRRGCSTLVVFALGLLIGGVISHFIW